MELTAQQRPPLSYSLPGFQRGSYRDHTVWLDDLRDLGFSWVTFTPTYLVYDENPARIDMARGPALDELEDAAGYAKSKGFQIRIDPHLDFETTLTGGPYEWRRRMLVNPAGAYFDEILRPLSGMCDELTLGSELDVSLAEFAPEWLRTRARIAGARIGHKLNHDSLKADSGAIRDATNKERRRAGLTNLGWREFRRKVAAVGEYLATLDYVAFSFYPDVSMRKPESWWSQPTSPDHVDAVASEFEKKARDLREQLTSAAGERPAFSIGEFGIGCDDPVRPYDFDIRTLLNAAGGLRPEARELRRKYYLGFLECLRRNEALFGREPVAFWTVAQFDFLGAMAQPGAEQFRDEALREAVRGYNSGA